MAISLVWLGVLIALLFSQASSDASRVQHGQSATFAIFGFRITTWGAERAAVTWSNPNVSSDLKPLAGKCLMYFGQSGGTAFLYQPGTLCFA